MSAHFDRVVYTEKIIFLKSLLISLLVFFVIAIYFINFYRRHVPLNPLVNHEAPFLEAELVEKKSEPKLYQDKSTNLPKKSSEVSVSKKLKTGNEQSKKMQSLFEDENRTVIPHEGDASPNHGPQVIFSPSPKLPEYLRDQNIKTTVLIEFFIPSSGSVVVSLIGSSGNEELDALAIQTAKKWLFQPAKKDGKPVDSKVRLRINFEVD